MKHRFIIEKQDTGQRADLFLSEKLETSRSQIKKLFEEKNVTINGKAAKSGIILAVDDVVCCDYEPIRPMSAEAEKIDLEIVYEDDDLAVINKPKGLVTHPAPSNRSGTLVNGLVYHLDSLSNVNGKIRPGIVHRLDKDTSGLLVVAKNDKAHNNLAKQIENKSCKRQYIAIINGHFKRQIGEIRTGIMRNKKDRKKMMACEVGQGKLAITQYETLEIYNGYSLVKFNLLTGRTHQIRVHCSHLHHSILGDKIYGCHSKLYNEGQLLCANRIEFEHPTLKKPMFFEIELPSYFVKIIEYLRNNSLQN